MSMEARTAYERLGIARTLLPMVVVIGVGIPDGSASLRFDVVTSLR